MGPMVATAQGLCEFIDASPSPFHVCATVASRLRAAGYAELMEAQRQRARLLCRAGRVGQELSPLFNAGGGRLRRERACDGDPHEPSMASFLAHPCPSLQ